MVSPCMSTQASPCFMLLLMTGVETQRLHRMCLWQADQPTLLHHRRVLAHADPSLSCSRCSGEVLCAASCFPRWVVTFRLV